MPQDRFRRIADLATRLGYRGGFPNFHQADYGDGTVFGVHFVKGPGVEWRDVPSAELGDASPDDDIPQRFRAVANYASAQGYVGGFPNFHNANYGAGEVFGTLLLRGDGVLWKDVPAAEFGNPDSNDVPERFRSTADYASREGFAAGFPNFHEADYGNGKVFGTFLLKDSIVTWKDVPEDTLYPQIKEVSATHRVVPPGVTGTVWWGVNVGGKVFYAVRGTLSAWWVRIGYLPWQWGTVEQIGVIQGTGNVDIPGGISARLRVRNNTQHPVDIYVSEHSEVAAQFPPVHF